MIKHLLPSITFNCLVIYFISDLPTAAFVGLAFVYFELKFYKIDIEKTKWERNNEN